MKNKAIETMKDLEIHMNAPQGASQEALEAYIKKACAGDKELEARVKALFDAEIHGDKEFLEEPAFNESFTLETDIKNTNGAEEVGHIIGRYKLLEKIGEGGFGSVWAAEQQEPIKRKVALKIIKLGMDSKQVVARFEAERQALALMDHPNIAKVLDASTTEKGRPFFVMELVKGIPITKYIKQENPECTKKLNLFISVCRAIQHAHQKGIIHRDIKPSNVMVTLHDGEPVPKVIDFGIAKATQGNLTDKTVYTQYSQFIGTPAYMSPEQAEMSGLDVDTRSDIYSLGVLLYEMLTGSPPFESEELLASGVDMMRKIIREKDPVKPSTRLSQILQETSKNKRNITSVPLSSDLDWIVLKCLEKDRSRRYETANGLAQDIERHLKNETVFACPPSVVYRLKKAWSRNKLAVSAMIAVAASLVLGLSASLWMARVAKNEKILADQARIDAETSEREKEDQRKKAEKAKQEAENNALIAKKLERSMRVRAYAADMHLAQRALEENDIGKARKLLGRYETTNKKEDLRGWEWRFLWTKTRDQARKVISDSPAFISDLATSRNGQWLAISRNQHSINLRNLWSGKEETIFSGKQITYSRVAFSKDGNQLAYHCTKKGFPGKIIVHLYNVNTREIIRRIDLPINDATCLGLNYSLNDRSLLITTSGKNIKLWAYDLSNESTAAPRLLTQGTDISTRVYSSPIAVSEDVPTAIVLVNKSEIRAFDILNEKELWSHHLKDTEILALAISPDGKQIAIGSVKGEPEVILIETETRKEIARFKGHRAWIGRLTFLEGGKVLASTSADQTIRLWDLESFKPMGVLRGHTREIWAMANLPDHSLISGSKSGEIKLWDPPSNQKESTMDPMLTSTEGITAFSFSPNNESINAFQNQKIIRFHGESFQKRETILTFESPQEGIFQPNGWLFAHGGNSKSIEIFDLRDGLLRGRIPIKMGYHMNSIGFNQDGTGLWVIKTGMWPAIPSKRFIQEWKFGEKEPNQTIEIPKTSGISFFGVNITVGTKGWIFGTDSDRRLWAKKVNETGLRNHYWTMPPHGIEAGKGRSSPLLNFFAIGQDSGIVNVWDLSALENGQTPTLKKSLDGAIVSYHGITFSNDDKRLVATSGWSQFLTLWETENFEPLLTLPGKGWIVRLLSFSPDGNTLAACSREGLHVWKAPSLEKIEAAKKDFIN